MLEPINGDKCRINPLPNPGYPLTVVASGESESNVAKVNQAQVINEFSELSEVNTISILPTIHLLMGTHNIVEVLDDKRR